MKILGQLGVLCGICLGGAAISAILPFAFPSSVAAMALLFLLLLCKAVKLQQIEAVGDFLLQNMAFFFIPAAVRILESFDVIRPVLWQMLLICSVTTVITFAAAGWTVQWVMALQQKGEKSDEQTS